MLLHGIMPETPLGQIVQIRSEDDKEMIKHFTPHQKKIRDSWRLRISKEVNDTTTEEQGEQMIAQIQSMFAKAFG